MNKKSILKKIANLHPEYRTDSNYIFRINGHAITGCALEFTPSCLYLWKLLIPLYDPFPFMHLTLSKRIGFLERFDAVNGENRGFETVVKYIEAIANDFGIFDMSPINPEEILEITSYSENSDLYAKKINAFSKIYLGRSYECLDDIKQVASVFLENPSQEILSGSDEILKALSIDNLQPKILLENWESENKVRISYL